jgi:hypothetical protein
MCFVISEQNVPIGHRSWKSRHDFDAEETQYNCLSFQQQCIIFIGTLHPTSRRKVI